jgi:hypothetical protein
MDNSRSDACAFRRNMSCRTPCMQVFQQWIRNILVSARGEASDPVTWDLSFHSRPHELTIRPAGSPLITGTEAVRLTLQ